MKKLFSLIFLFSILQLTAQTVDSIFISDEKEDTAINEIDELDEEVDDSLRTIFFTPIEYSDSFYAARLSQIPSEIPLTYNEHVRCYIDVYAKKRRTTVERLLGLKDIYFPIFEEAFDKYNIPHSMKYLAVIESALNPYAVSRAGAVGLWQFIHSTGKLYDLDVDQFIDERKDPYKASEAAARHLRDLYDFYNDWQLALAAYNCGAHNVNKAIARSGGKTNYWEILKFLPRETRGYVPAFIAAAYIMNNYNFHGFIPQPPTVCFDTTCSVLIEKQTHFNSVSKYIGLSVEEISHLNPELKRFFIPREVTPYWLNLPSDKVGLFEQNQDSIFSESEKIQLPQIAKFNWQGDFNIVNKTEIIYTVKQGDNVGFIADWFDCRVQDVRLWNDIYRNRIKAGQRLRIYVSKGKTDYYKKIDKMNFAQKQQLSGKTLASNSTIKSTTTDGKYFYHTIKSGDTLWDIAKLYPKTTIEEIKRINNIASSKSLKPGTVIKIPSG